MRPLLFSSGNTDANAKNKMVVFASMRPLLFSSGNVNATTGAASAAELQ